MRKFQGTKTSTIGLVSAVALVLAGCSNSTAPADAEEIGVCIDPKTENRIDDDKCTDGYEGWESSDGSVWFWYSTSSGHTAPPVGQRINKSHGYTGGPKSTSYARGGVPSSGSVISKSTIARGGFGAGNAGKGSTGG